MWTPDSIAKLQHATRTGNASTYEEYAKLINDQTRKLKTLRGLFEFRTAGRTPVPVEEVEPAATIVQALRHRRDEPRLDLDRGAHDARDRDEPHRRQVEHRRGRRGRRALSRRNARRPERDQGRRHAGRHARTRAHRARRAAQGRRQPALEDQAGGLRALRRHRRVPCLRRPDPDQDGAGREARRGRTAARPQGIRVHRQAALLGARRRPDLAAAAPRHLLDRGPGPADPRPQERQPARVDLGEAGLRGRRRHGRGRVWRRPSPTT